VLPLLHSLLSKRFNGIVSHNSGLDMCGVIRDEPW
jgi:hypothetical protein